MSAPPGDATGGWAARLELEAWRDGDSTRTRNRHSGPLRLLKSLYPEGPAVCHEVMVHPPGGIVGGDSLDLELNLQRAAHVLVSTPGATRWYRSDGRPARQHTRLRLAAGARLEWLPAETIAHPGCLATNRVELDLAPGAEAMLSELLVLGLPASNEAFADDASGFYEQHLEWPGRWLERGAIRARDRRLLASPLGLGGQPVLATLAFAACDAEADSPAARARRGARQAALLDAARECIDAAPGLSAGATAPNPDVLLLRVVAPRAEPAQQLLRAVWARWRGLAWGLRAPGLRLWRC